eukprot:SM000191S05219  [mRNA]  locus=s191:109330:119214:+ [translate_table: standard]
MAGGRAPFRGAEEDEAEGDGGDGGEDEEEEEEEDGGDEEGRGGRGGGAAAMLGFMFGNVDSDGGLDAEYLDEDARGQLSALASQLGPSLVDMELTSSKTKSAGSDNDATELEDKIDNAEDFADINETAEDDSTFDAVADAGQASLALAPLPTSQLGRADSEDKDDYDEDDYDAEDRYPAAVSGKEVKASDGVAERPPVEVLDGDDEQREATYNLPVAEKHRQSPDEVEAGAVAAGLEHRDLGIYGLLARLDADVKEETGTPGEPNNAQAGPGMLPEVVMPLEQESEEGEEGEEADGKEARQERHSKLPVLYQEDGKEIVQFTELFGTSGPYWAARNRRLRPRRYRQAERSGADSPHYEGDDDEDILRRAAESSLPPAGDAEEDSQGPSSQVSLTDEGGDEGTEDDDEEGSQLPKRHTGLMRTSLPDDALDPSVINSRELHVQEAGDQASTRGFVAVGSDSPGQSKQEATRKGWRHRGYGRIAESLPDKPLLEEPHAVSLLRLADIPSTRYDAVQLEEWEAHIAWGTPVREVEGLALDIRREPAARLKEYSSSDSDSEEGHGLTGAEDTSWQQKKAGEEWMKLSTSSATPAMQIQGVTPIAVEKFEKRRRGVRIDPANLFRHPQMLRLESTPRSSKDEGDDAAGAGVGLLSPKVQKILLNDKLKNSDLERDRWYDDIMWEGEAPEPRQHCVVFNFNDPHMVFEVPDSKEGLRLRAHAAAILVVGQQEVATKRDAMGEAKETGAGSRWNISNDRHYVTKKLQKSHAKKRTLHVLHSLPALKLQTMKPRLTIKDLGNFHRPKLPWFPHHNETAARQQGKLQSKGRITVFVKTLGGLSAKVHMDASDSLEVLKTRTSKKIKDLTMSEPTKFLLCGKELEEGKPLAEQQVRPNSLLHMVRTTIMPWPFASTVPDESKPRKPPRAFRKISELSLRDGHAVLMEYCEERPLLLSNAGMAARLGTYYRKMTATDNTAASLASQKDQKWIGLPLPLEPTEDSPFLGNIRPGETQSSLETNMFRAPTFQHTVPSTDFLLVRSAGGKLSLRRIDCIHVVGQQEPHVEVLTPNSKPVDTYNIHRLLVYVYRIFRSFESKPGQQPKVRADEVTKCFPQITEVIIRKRLKHCADLQKGAHSEMWWAMRKGFRIPTEEELRRLVTPEQVCANEAMLAGLFRLQQMGISHLLQPQPLAAAMHRLPDDALQLAAASTIERELQLTAWQLSSNFVAATVHGRGSLERLEIAGAGDPTGRGLGFSFLRAAPKQPGPGVLLEKKAAAARGGGSVTGTDADLRRLSMEAAKEILLRYGVPEEEISKLTRWHRIALVRKKSSEQVAAGGVAMDSRFARGQRMSIMQLQQQTREACQEIWDKQASSLAGDGDGYASDAEGGDLDLFAGDLENLLEAEEGVSVPNEERNSRRGLRGLGARRRAWEAERQEVMEDEEAEAAELRRMLMEDEDADEADNKMARAVKGKALSGTQNPPPSVEKGQPLGPFRKKVTRLKRIIRTKRADGTITVKEVLITDPKEIEKVLAKMKAKSTEGGQPQAASPKLPVKSKKPHKVGLSKGPAIKGESSLKAKIMVKHPIGAEGGASGGGEKPRKRDREKERIRRREKAQALAMEKAKAAEKDGEVQRGVVLCGACGEVGHMRTNKMCRLYEVDEEGNQVHRDGALAEGLLERQGMKVTLKKRMIEERCNAAAAVPEPLLPKLRLLAPTPQALERINTPRSSAGDLARLQSMPPLKIRLSKPATAAGPAGVVKDEVGEGGAEPGEERGEGASKLLRSKVEEGEHGSEPRPKEVETTKQARKGEKEERRRKKDKKRKRRDGRHEGSEERERRRGRRPASASDAEMSPGLSRSLTDRMPLPSTSVLSRLDRPSRPSTTSPAPRRTRKSGLVELANVLEEVVELLKAETRISYLFLAAVPKHEAPDYNQIVKHPIHLGNIQEQVRKLVYLDREHFRADVKRIAENAHLYNDHKNPWIPPMADELLRLCDNELANRDIELAEAEADISDQVDGSQKVSQKVTIKRSILW